MDTMQLPGFQWSDVACGALLWYVFRDTMQLPALNWSAPLQSMETIQLAALQWSAVAWRRVISCIAVVWIPPKHVTFRPKLFFPLNVTRFSALSFSLALPYPSLNCSLLSVNPRNCLSWIAFFALWSHHSLHRSAPPAMPFPPCPSLIRFPPSHATRYSTMICCFLTQCHFLQCAFLICFPRYHASPCLELVSFTRYSMELSSWIAFFVLWSFNFLHWYALEYPTSQSISYRALNHVTLCCIERIFFTRHYLELPVLQKIIPFPSLICSSRHAISAMPLFDSFSAIACNSLLYNDLLFLDTMSFPAVRVSDMFPAIPCISLPWTGLFYSVFHGTLILNCFFCSLVIQFPTLICSRVSYLPEHFLPRP